MLKRKIFQLYTKAIFIKNKVTYKLVISIGTPDIQIKKGGLLRIDGKINMVNNSKDSVLGNPRKCKLLVYKNAILHFKGDVSMSNTVIVATKKISIGNNVMMGAGVTIIDSDFHSLNYKDWNTADDEKNMVRKDVVIGDNVFLGTECLIMKGVHIGDNSIIAARTVVVNNIPQNEIWGGNPAHFIKKNN